MQSQLQLVTRLTGLPPLSCVGHGHSDPLPQTPQKRRSLVYTAKGLPDPAQDTAPTIADNPSSYGMHSLRRGGVVAAWQAGVDIERLKAHGRWRSDAIIRSYMTGNTAIKLSVTRCM